MASVVTVYCAGTAYDSKSDDIVAWLNSRTAGTRSRDLFFFPGPGSGEFAASLTTAAVADTAAAVARSAVGKLPQVRIEADTVQAAARGINAAQQLLDKMTGTSLHERIALAVRQLREAKAAGSQINLVGWSRGAVTCLGIAYALAEDSELRSCKVNLFLFDPVPGPERENSANWSRELTSLRSNINALAVVLMENDDRDWMLPPLTAPFTSCARDRCGEVDAKRITLYPLPGAHASAVETTGLYVESAAIGAHLVSRFLQRHGTSVPADKLLTDAALLDAYARLKRKAFYGFTGRESSTEWRLSPTLGVTRVSVPVARLAKIPNEFRATRFFVNEHHKRLMAKHYPALAWILDPAMPPLGWSVAAEHAITRLKAVAPNMAQLIGDGVAAILAVPNICLRDADDLKRLHKAMGYHGEVPATLIPTRPSATGTMPAVRATQW